MKNIWASLIWLVIIFIVGVLGTVSFFPYPAAPFDLHQSAPLPVVCAGYSCVTYRQWSKAVKNDDTKKTPEVVLTALVFDEVTRQVADYEKVRISKDEIRQAVSAVEQTINAMSGGKNLINEAYAGKTEKYLSEKNVSRILLRQKLAALGVANIWVSKYVPKITVLNVSLKWDDAGKKIVRK